MKYDTEIINDFVKLAHPNSDFDHFLNKYFFIHISRAIQKAYLYTSSYIDTNPLLNLNKLIKIPSQPSRYIRIKRKRIFKYLPVNYNTVL